MTPSVWVKTASTRLYTHTYTTSGNICMIRLLRITQEENGLTHGHDRVLSQRLTVKQCQHNKTKYVIHSNNVIQSNIHHSTSLCITHVSDVIPIHQRFHVLKSHLLSLW